MYLVLKLPGMHACRDNTAYMQVKCPSCRRLRREENIGWPQKERFRAPAVSATPCRAEIER